MTAPVATGELIAALESLVRRAREQSPRAELLTEAGCALLRLTQAESLELQLEARGDRQRWGATRGAERLTPLPLAAPEPEALRFPFEVDADARGLLLLSVPAARVVEVEAPSRLLALVLGAALSRSHTQAALTERVKELACVYRLAQLAAEERPLAETLQDAVRLLPPAWQHPHDTCARITLDGRAFCSAPFEERPHRLAAELRRGDQPVGQVEVFCFATGTAPPFLPEETNLIEAVARELTLLIERRRAVQEAARLQEQVRHADRLATVGQLAAGIAHELNDPLGNILGFAQLSAKATNLPPETRRDLEQIVKASLHARGIIRNLMFFARQGPSQRVELDLNHAIREALSLLEPATTRAGVTLTLDLAQHLPPVSADPAQLQQVAINLIRNALQAMPEGGTLRLTTSRARGEVLAVVEDSGPGIAPADLPHLFEPFFTTKGVGAGTGLGLSVVHGIVTAHGGSVEAHSRSGGGARFEVRLPAREGRDD